MNNTQRLYFVSIDNADTIAKGKVLETVNRLGRGMPHAGGILLWSERDLRSLNAEISQVAQGESIVAPVEQQSITQGGALTGQVDQFVKNIRAA